MKKKNRNNKSKDISTIIVRAFAVIVALALISLTLAASSRFFTVNAIECVLISNPCPEELSSSLEPLLGHQMFFEDYSQLLTESYAFTQPVSLIDIKKKFPRTVIVTFQPEAAAYVWSHDNTAVVISQTGKIFTQQFQNPPKLIVESTDRIDTDTGKIDPAIHHTILSIQTTAEELLLPLTRITWVDKSTIRLTMENSTEIFILDSERPTLELHKLAMVLKSGEYKNIAEPKAELDLRFTMPVLRTQP